MIRAVLFSKEDFISGFEISGHSTKFVSDFDGKLVCAAVSSAVIMAANTITDVIGDKADIDMNDGYLRLHTSNPAKCAQILNGLKLHLSELTKEYPDKIKVIMEVEP